MTRFNILLLIALVCCSLAVVTSQHKARKLFMGLQDELDLERKTDQEWRELQIESQTLGTGKRIEQKAMNEIGMRQPDAKKTVIVIVDSSGFNSNAIDTKKAESKITEADTEANTEADTKTRQ